MHYFTTKTISKSDCIAIGVFQDQIEQALLSKEQQASVQKIKDLGDFTGKVGQTTVQYLLPGFDHARVILFGLGGKAKYSLKVVRNSMSALGKAVLDCQAKTLQIILPPVADEDEQVLFRQAIISLEDANIQRDQFKTKPASHLWPEQISFVGNNVNDQALLQGLAIANGIKLAKNLANLPGNKCTPRLLAEYAVTLAEQHDKLSAEIYDEKQLQELKMGCLLAVAQGSVEPPRLIVVQYRGAAENSAPTVLVGKGITFDSGGLSLKGRSHMDEMKYDMSGAAAVLGVLKAASELNLPINLVAIIPSAENLPSGNALKPGDIITSMAGKTVEVIDTDAEGRLVLCDALTFAERFNPKEVIDLATLTGAIIVTFGAGASGVMANDDQLAQQLCAAGDVSGDRAWQLPIWEEYQDLLDTAFADVANLGNDEAKSITAACFLARFTEKYRWAHLDIAGTAWRGGSNKNRAATGRPISLLMHYLLQSYK